MSTIGHLTVHFLYPKILLLGTNIEHWIYCHKLSKNMSEMLEDLNFRAQIMGFIY